MTNPYIAGPPVRGKAFYGRETIAAAILNSPYPALRVLGMRHIGKTALLHHLAEISPALYLDFQGATGDPARLARRMRQQLRRGRRRFPWLPAGDKGDDPIELLEKADGEAEHAGATLLLLGDEAEDLAQFDDAFLKGLRGFIWDSVASRIVLTATKRLAKLDDRCRSWDTSPFLSGFPPPLYLASLGDEAAAALIRQSQSDTPLEVLDAVVAAILEHTGNHPYLIQWLCYQLWQKSSQPDKWVITSDDLTPVDDLVRYFQMDFDYLSPGERAILLTVAEGTATDASSLSETTGLPAGDVSLFLHTLTHLGYLRERGGQLSLGNRFLDRWLQNNRARLKIHEAGQVSDRTELEVIRQERIASLQEQRIIHIKNLSRLEEQAARHGMAVPTKLLNEMDYERKEIDRIETELKQLNRREESE
jgi:hypothetical protein